MDEVEKEVAFASIVTDDPTYAPEIDKIWQFFEKCKEASGKTSFNRDLFTFLDAAKNGDTSSWKVVNKYQRNGKGYSLEAWEKLKELANIETKEFSDLKMLRQIILKPKKKEKKK